MGAVNVDYRIKKIEDEIEPGRGQNQFIVRRVDGGKYVSPCDMRKAGCPDFPCQPSACWYNKANPDMDEIHIGPEVQDEHSK